MFDFSVPKNLLKNTIFETNFKFKIKFYDQIDGVAMGSPLGSLLTKFLLFGMEILEYILL